jgi:hypothetical protein
MTAVPVQTALWGAEEPRPAAAVVRGGTNDVELVSAVIRTAATAGYVLVGPAKLVYVREAGDTEDVQRVPSYEAEAVAQLLGSGHFTVGRSRTVCVGGRRGPARSVLVKAATIALVRRWATLRPC